MKQALLLTTITITFIFNSFGQKANTEGKNLPRDFRKISYDKVIAYDLDSAGFIVEDGILNSKIIKNQKVLLPAQIDTLNKFLYLTKKIKKADDTFTKQCYTHRIGIVYYLNDKIVADFSIPHDCNVFYLYVKTLTDPVDNYSKTTINNYSFHLMSFNQVGQNILKALYDDLNFN